MNDREKRESEGDGEGDGGRGGQEGCKRVKKHCIQLKALSIFCITCAKVYIITEGSFFIFFSVLYAKKKKKINTHTQNRLATRP